MGMYTYIMPNEVDAMKQITDIELNELYQQIRKAFNDKIMLKETEVTHKRFLKKPIIKTLYTVYTFDVPIDAPNDNTIMEVRVMNFKIKDGPGITTYVEKFHIFSFFYGLTNAHYYLSKK